MDALGMLAKVYGLVSHETVPKPKKKPSMLKDLISCPDDFELNARIENEEIVVRIKRMVDDD